MFDEKRVGGSGCESDARAAGIAEVGFEDDEEDRNEVAFVVVVAEVVEGRKDVVDLLLLLFALLLLLGEAEKCGFFIIL